MVPGNVKITPASVQTLPINLANALSTAAESVAKNWQYYKIKAFRLEMWPTVQGSSRVNTEGAEGSTPHQWVNDPLYLLCVPNPDFSITSNDAGALLVSSDPKCHWLTPNRKVDMYRKLYPSIDVNSGGITIKNRNTNVSTADLNFNWGKICFARHANDPIVNPGTQPDYSYKMRVTYYVTFSKFNGLASVQV